MTGVPGFKSKIEARTRFNPYVTGSNCLLSFYTYHECFATCLILGRSSGSIANNLVRRFSRSEHKKELYCI